MIRLPTEVVIQSEGYGIADETCCPSIGLIVQVPRVILHFCNVNMTARGAGGLQQFDTD